MNQNDWITVEQTPLEAVAEMMRGRLQAEGIEAVLRGNRASSTAGVVSELNLSWANPLGGVEVRVHRADEARAREILAHDERDEADRAEARLRVTPLWVQVWGAAFAAGTLFYAASALSNRVEIGVGAALLGFGLVLWLGRRGGKI